MFRSLMLFGSSTPALNDSRWQNFNVLNEQWSAFGTGVCPVTVIKPSTALLQKCSEIEFNPNAFGQGSGSPTLNGGIWTLILNASVSFTLRLDFNDALVTGRKADGTQLWETGAPSVVVPQGRMAFVLCMNRYPLITPAPDFYFVAVL